MSLIASFFAMHFVHKWPIASIRTHTLNGRYRRHSGHCSALARNGSVANDPQRTSGVDAQVADVGVLKAAQPLARLSAEANDRQAKKT
jgi:hypothetical protein